MKLMSVVGARPNFMKIAPFINAIKQHNASSGLPKIVHTLVHTGQHYDERMNDNFFRSLCIDAPDVNLGIGSGSHAQQVGYTMIAFEKTLVERQPDWVVVVGDVNATLACSVTAKKMGIKVCHIEAGLRSGDMSMPEEINRLVTDRLSDLLLTPDRLSTENLSKEGVDKSKVAFVGNIMIDSLELQYDRAALLDVRSIVSKNKMATKSIFVPPFAVVTLHRPSNVDKLETLLPIVDFMIQVSAPSLTVLWTLHPRTLKMLKEFRILDKLVECARIILLHPLDYHEMLRLNMDAAVMITDSGGLQEECTVLGTPCLTLRKNTERPITLREWSGVGVLVGNDMNKLAIEFQKAIRLKRSPFRPELWDGKTAERCLQQIILH